MINDDVSPVNNAAFSLSDAAELAYWWKIFGPVKRATAVCCLLAIGCWFLLLTACFMSIVWYLAFAVWRLTLGVLHFRLV